MAPNYVSGALTALAAVQSRATLLRRQAEDSAARAGLGKDIGIADAEADLAWEQESNTLAAAARALTERLANEDAARAASMRAWNAEEQRRRQALQIAENNQRIAANADRLAAARRAVQAATAVKATPAYKPTYKGKPIDHEGEVRAIVESVKVARSVEEALALGKVNGPKHGSRPAAVAAGIRAAFTADGRVSDAFQAWQGGAEQEWFGAWQNRDAVRALTAERARAEAENRDGWGMIPDIGSKVFGGIGKALALPFGAVGEAAGDAVRPFSRFVIERMGASPEAAAYLTRDVRGLPTSPAAVAGEGISALKNAQDGALGFALDAANVVGGLAGDPLNLVPVGLTGRLASRGFKAIGGQTARQAIGETATGRVLRQGFVPFSSTTDFARSVTGVREAGDALAKAGRSVLREQEAFVSGLTGSVDRRLAPFGKVSESSNLDIHRALESGNAAGTAAAWRSAGRTQDADLLDTLDSFRYEAVDTLIKAGVDPETLRDPAEYVRRIYTDEGREALGLPPLKDSKIKAGMSKTGTMKKRTFLEDATADDLVAELGVEDALFRDPVKLVAGSLKQAQEVLGRAEMTRGLAAEAAELGIEGVVKAAPARGYTKVAPNAYLPDTIKDDFVNLRKSGTHLAAVRLYDKVLAKTRIGTLLNPVSALPYMSRNLYTATLVNVLKGMGAGDFTLYSRADRLYSKLGKAVDAAAGEGGDAGLRAALKGQGLTDDEVGLAMELRQSNLFQPERGIFEDVEKVGREGQGAPLGARTAARANNRVEAVPRAALYIKLRQAGKSARDAADEVFTSHFDYGATGFTRFERDYVKRATLFYSFLRKYPAQFAKLAFNNPRAVAIMQDLGIGFTNPDDQNQYGVPKGWFLETPLQTLSAFPTELADLLPGSSQPGSGSSGAAKAFFNPLIQFAIGTSENRGSDGPLGIARGLLPPLDRIMKEGAELSAAARGDAGTPEGLGNRSLNAAIKMSGLKYGKSPEDNRLPVPGTPEYVEIDWAKQPGESLDIELRRLNIKDTQGMSKEDKAEAIAAAAGKINAEPRSHTSLAAAARRLNIPGFEVERMDDGQLAAAIESLGGKALPVVPKDSLLRDIAKLYGIDVPPNADTATLLALVQGTPEFQALLRASSTPGYAEGAAAQSFFARVAENQALMQMIGAG